MASNLDRTNQPPKPRRGNFRLNQFVGAGGRKPFRSRMSGAIERDRTLIAEARPDSPRVRPTLPRLAFMRDQVEPIPARQRFEADETRDPKN